MRWRKACSLAKKATGRYTETVRSNTFNSLPQRRHASAFPSASGFFSPGPVNHSSRAAASFVANNNGEPLGVCPAFGVDDLNNYQILHYQPGGRSLVMKALKKGNGSRPKVVYLKANGEFNGHEFLTSQRWSGMSPEESVLGALEDLVKNRYTSPEQHEVYNLRVEEEVLASRLARFWVGKCHAPVVKAVKANIAGKEILLVASEEMPAVFFDPKDHVSGRPFMVDTDGDTVVIGIDGKLYKTAGRIAWKYAGRALSDKDGLNIANLGIGMIPIPGTDPRRQPIVGIDLGDCFQGLNPNICMLPASIRAEAEYIFGQGRLPIDNQFLLVEEVDEDHGVSHLKIKNRTNARNRIIGRIAGTDIAPFVEGGFSERARDVVYVERGEEYNRVNVIESHLSYQIQLHQVLQEMHIENDRVKGDYRGL